MSPNHAHLLLSRRDLLKLGATGAALAPMMSPFPASAQTPKRGGTLSLRLWDPPHWDPHLTVSYKTHIAYSFTHSRLVKHKAGPGVQPGTFPLEGDLAESWTQPNENTYVFKLRRGVKWHNKPPVNGRELVADDVVYTLERFRTVKGNANAYMLAALDRVEAVDKYTVKFTLKEPYAWFLDILANPHAVCIVAKECVEKFGDLKKPEATVGTGPVDAGQLPARTSASPSCATRATSWPVSRTSTRSRLSWTRTMPRAWPRSSRASTTSAGSSRDRSTAPIGCRSRTRLKQRRPNLKTQDYPANVMTHLYFRNDKAPFSDVRVRRAMSMAIDRKGIIDATAEGLGVQNPAVPAALKEWSIPVDQLGEGAQYFKHDPAAARKLLAEAGHPKGFPVTIDFTTYGSQVLVDACQLVLKNLKDVGIEAKLNTKEYGAYISSTFYGKYESMALGPQTPFLEPDNFLFGQYYPGEIKNHGHINDPVLADMLVRQRRTMDAAKRREIIYEDPATHRQAAVRTCSCGPACTSGSGTGRS